jgi:hypothetical protein
MKIYPILPSATFPDVKIYVSGKLFQGHLSYLNQLVHTAGECRLWPVLSLAHLEELDRAALLFLIEGENRTFGVALCPNFVREWMEHERGSAAAA